MKMKFFCMVTNEKLRGILREKDFSTIPDNIKNPTNQYEKDEQLNILIKQTKIYNQWKMDQGHKHRKRKYNAS